MSTRTNTYDRLLAAARQLLQSGSVPTAGQVAEEAGVSLSTYHRAVESHASLLADAGHIAEPSARDRLLDAAIALLGEVTVRSLLMEDVAARAGVSRGTLYRIFPGKPALFEELARSRAPLASLGTALKALGDRPPSEVLPNLIAAATPRLMSNRGLIRALVAEGSNEAIGTGREMVRSMYREIVDYIVGRMEAGQLRKMDPTVATIALLGPLLTYTVTLPDLWFGDESAPDAHETIAALVQVWLRGMAPLDQEGE